MSGYWSNLNKDEEVVTRTGSVIAVDSNIMDMIYSPVRAEGLKLLQIQKDQMGIDYGCGWGALLIPAAKQCKLMVGMDYTTKTLKFVYERIRDNKLNNCILLNRDLKEGINLYGMFDFAIVNGVLEWIPVEEDVELKKYFRRGKPKFVDAGNPREKQLKFLKMVYANLKKGGKLYLGIENRYNWKYFLGKRDEHTNLPFTSILPRKWANLICNLWYGRAYVTYTYSYMELLNLLVDAGFDWTQFCSAYPNYRFPQKTNRGTKHCPSYIVIAVK